MEADSGLDVRVVHNIPIMYVSMSDLEGSHVLFWKDLRFQEFLNSTQAQVVTWMTVLLILLVVAYYLVQRFRDQSDEDQPGANEMLTNFREMKEQGDISEFEFRRLKTVLGDQLKEEFAEPLTDTEEGNQAG